MRLIACFLLLSEFILIGCDSGPTTTAFTSAPAPAPATATTPTEILIASQPSAAIILMDGMEIGVTPMKLKMSKDTQIQIRKNGYLPYTEIMSVGGNPNLLARLEKAPNSGLGLVTEDTLSGETGPSNGLAPEPTTKPQPVDNVKPARTYKKPRKKSKPLTVARLKQMYRSGAISKQAYKQNIRRLQSELDRTLRQLKARYRRGDFDKSEYARRVRQAKHRYTG